jgi:hypothetical protein
LLQAAATIKMESSILQQYWDHQEKQRPISLNSFSTRSAVATIDENFDYITSRHSAFTSKSPFQTDFESNSRSLVSPSSTNITIKEFCPTEEEEDEEEKQSSRKCVYRQEKMLVFVKEISVHQEYWQSHLEKFTLFRFAESENLNF